VSGAGAVAYDKLGELVAAMGPGGDRAPDAEQIREKITKELATLAGLTGNFRVEGLVDPKPGVEWSQGVDKFRFNPGDIQAWNDLGNVEVVVFHSWNTSRVRIASVDKDKGVVAFTGPTIFRPLAWDPNQRYYVENARELLDAPGEWYLDRSSGVLS
jgi:hypothetical protein